MAQLKLLTLFRHIEYLHGNPRRCDAAFLAKGCPGRLPRNYCGMEKIPYGAVTRTWIAFPVNPMFS